MEKISATIITFNEEENIEGCLKSLSWVDEIVIIDSFSDDKTLEICRKYTDKVFEEDWKGYGKQKNLAAFKASHRWILNLDADEVVSEACASEIRREFESGPRHTLYRFPRKNYFAGRWVRFGGWYPDYIFRLYDKTQVAFSEKKVHERLTPENDSGVFQESLEHYSYKNYEDYISRQNRYSTLFAEEKKMEGKRAGAFDLIFRPPVSFFKAYILQQGFREGILGFFLAISSAFYTFLKYVKTRSI